MSTPQIMPLSNELADFVEGGGLYPGGTGIAKEFRYKLWDYNGKFPPNSQVAVYLQFQPTDGSNDGKDVEIYWNVGSAENMLPDHSGGFLIPNVRPGKEPIKGLSASANWHQVLESMSASGLPGGKLSGPTGIRIVEGSEITLARVDQKERDIQRNTPQAPGQQPNQNQNQKRTILVVTRARWSWEGNAAAPARRGRPAAAAAPAAAPVANAAPAPAAAPAASNGAGGGPLIDAISAVLAANAEGVALEDLTKLVTDQLGSAGIGARDRIALLKQVKDLATLEQLAAQNNWAIEDGVIFG